jgi:flagellar export protein FliJ
MASDRLRVVQGVRQRAVEQARQALGLCLKTETEATARILAIDDAARRDRAADRSGVDALPFGEMFTRRLGALQTERRDAVAALTAAETGSAQARAAVTAARTAAEAVETLIAERAAAEATETSRREQHTLDDIARARFVSAGTGD